MYSIIMSHYKWRNMGWGRFRTKLKGIFGPKREVVTRGFHDGEYEDRCLLGCSSVYSGRILPAFSEALDASSFRAVSSTRLNGATIQRLRKTHTPRVFENTRICSFRNEQWSCAFASRLSVVIVILCNWLKKDKRVLRSSSQVSRISRQNSLTIVYT